MAGLLCKCLSCGMDPVSGCGAMVKKGRTIPRVRQSYRASTSATRSERARRRLPGVRRLSKSPKPEKAAIHLEPLQREALFREFADYLRTPRRQNAAVYLEPGQREALFQQFAEYQKRQYLMIASRYPAADH